VPAGRDNRFAHTRRALVCVAGCLIALAAPGVAAAHGRALTVALDYRLPLDPSVAQARGVEANVVDGDRALHLVVASGLRVVVLGDLGEPMLRVDNGVWVNQASPTAQANRLVRKPAQGWKRVAGGHAYAWHEHRLAPPPFVAGSYGRVASWRVPLLVNGRLTAISGSFWRVPRPAFWPWVLGAGAAVGLAALALKGRPRLRRGTTIGAGVLASLAGLTAQTAFSLRDAPSGHIGWALLAAVFLIAAVAAWGLWAARGSERAFVAGTIGTCVAVFCLSWLGVFFHGAVVSVLSAQATRFVCTVAFTAGVVALVGVLLLDAPEGAKA
jgi:hypothetical protein